MIFCIFTHIPLIVNKSNFHFKRKSRITTDHVNKINVNMLQFSIVNFQIKFSLANQGCDYELNWANLYEN